MIGADVSVCDLIVVQTRFFMGRGHVVNIVNFRVGEDGELIHFLANLILEEELIVSEMR